jgi:hypothetical protein
MPHQPAAANAHHLATPFPVPQPWEAPDPPPVMRRDLKLLLIEMNVLRVEVEELRAMEREARKTEEFLSASVNWIMESRDHWRREEEWLGALPDVARACVKALGSRHLFSQHNSLRRICASRQVRIVHPRRLMARDREHRRLRRQT